MSHFVARGAPTAAQLYLDTVLAAAAAERAARGGAGGLDQLSLGQVLHYCLKTYPQDVFMTNGATGVRTTNQQLLEMAVPLARALAAAALAGQTVVVAARDHERTVALYLACIFAGVVAFMADPVYTKLELEYFIDLVEPRMIFCDGATQATVAAAARGAARVVAMHTDQLLDFSEGHSGDIADFRVPDADPRGTVLLLPTSGSTGLPKAVCYHGLGVLAQMPVPWMHHSRFPRPTERVMLLTTPQWGTFTVMVTACCAFRVELLMSPELPTVQHVIHMMDAYRPTWTFFAPSFAKDLVKVDARYFSSLKTVLTLGSPATPELFAALKEKMPAGSNVGDGFGLSELQSLIAHTHPAAQRQCSGPVANIMHYKLVKEDGTEAATNEPGELYVKGVNLIYGYYKNEAALASCLEDGWFRTGDEFTQDAAGTLYYRRRTKFTFKYNNQQVSPEEVERLIESIPYVKECVVCDSERGPVAGVVLHAGAPADSHARQAIHHAVEASLSDHKRLRGGVAIVASLAHTNNGKLKRHECRETLHQLMRDGLCQ